MIASNTRKSHAKEWVIGPTAATPASVATLEAASLVARHSCQREIPGRRLSNQGGRGRSLHPARTHRGWGAKITLNTPMRGSVPTA